MLTTTLTTMLKRSMQAILAIAFAAFSSVAACAQAAAVSGISNTDVSVSLYGAFSGKTTGNGVVQSPSNSAGGMIEVRHIANPLVGFEGTYSFNNANQVYRDASTCGFSCSGPPLAAISANAHEVTGDWVVSLKVANLRPFALAGAGVIFHEPTGNNQSGLNIRSNKGVLVYGAGLDWGLLPHLGLRLQYRGNVYTAPELIRGIHSSGAFVETSEPMIGVYLRL